MTNPPNPRSALPHHKLIAYGVAVDFLLAVTQARIRDANLRDQALRAAKSACLNVAEAAGRTSRADKARVFAIARGEAVEAVAAIEIAAHLGDTTQEAADPCVALASRLVALLTGLIRPSAAPASPGAGKSAGAPRPVSSPDERGRHRREPSEERERARELTVSK